MPDLKGLVKSHPTSDRLAREAITLAARARRPAQVRRFLASPGPRKVILGASTHQRPGWLATDLFPKGPGTVYLDATAPFPFPDESVDRILCEHMIEHVPHEEGLALLRECRRVLAPAGRLRLATPDLARVLSLAGAGGDDRLDAYVRWSNDEFGEGGDNPVPAINRMFRAWGHQFLYDRPTLEAALLEAGFTDVVACEVGRSADPEFDGIDFHGETIPAEWNELETLLLEATRP